MKYQLMPALGLITLAAFAAPGSLQAGPIIYNSGSPDQFGTYYADANYGDTDAAESFVLLSGSSTVAGAEWWGGCFEEVTCPSGDFTIGIYTDNSGAPGTLVESYDVGDADQTATGNSIGLLYSSGFDEYVYSASFTPLALTPGTEYWFVVGDNTGEVDTWGWETTNETGSLEQYGGGAWANTTGATLAFNLEGPSSAPEPSSLLLLAAGLLCVAAMRRKKRLA